MQLLEQHEQLIARVSVLVSTPLCETFIHGMLMWHSSSLGSALVLLFAVHPDAMSW
jgi:hypothetical protein